MGIKGMIRADREKRELGEVEALFMCMDTQEGLVIYPITRDKLNVSTRRIVDHALTKQ